MTPYYLVVEEWNYPTESGREVYADTFDTKAEALAKCELLAKDEFVTNFAAAVGQDALPPGRCEDGTLVTTKMGLDPFYYYVRVLTVEPAENGTLRLFNPDEQAPCPSVKPNEAICEERIAYVMKHAGKSREDSIRALEKGKWEIAGAFAHLYNTNTI